MSNDSSYLSAPCTKELHVKMCKKIADLTRVIDKLFRQYYEQTSSLDCLQLELKRQTVANEKLEKAKTQALSELERCRQEVNELKRVNVHSAEEVSSLRSQLTACMRGKDDCLSENAILKKSLQGVQNDYKELQLAYDKLIDSYEQRNREATQNDNTDLIMAMQKQLSEHSANIDKLSVENETLQDKYKELQKQYETTNEDCKQLREQLKGREATNDQLHSEKCQLQLQIAQLLSELQELRCNVQQRVKKVPNTKQKIVPIIKQRNEYWLQHSPKERKDEEVEKLKEELQRYRLELMNRESNFNRVFTDNTPIHLKQRGHQFNNAGGGSGLQLHLPRLQSTSSSSKSLIGPKRL